MKKSFISNFLLAVSLILIMVPLSQAQQSNQHMLWKIESNGELQGYLLGSIHVMKPGNYPLDQVYQKAFKEAEIVAFELNIDSLRIKMVPLVAQLALYPPGKSIKGTLSKETYALLQGALGNLNLPAARFNRFEPWFIAISLPSIQIKKAGFSAKSGIDMHFFGKAKKAGKKIAALETTYYQINLFDDLTPELQEKYLKYSLKHSDETIKRIDELVTAWIKGKVSKIEQIMQGTMKKNLPKLYEKLLIERNKNWIPKIKMLLSKEKTPLVIVGAGHMIGRKGLISLLERRGYQVEQL